MKHTILIVDDEVGNLDALERLFRKKYSVLKASSGAEGLNILKNTPVTLIISDQRMPSMSGVEFLKNSIELSPEAIKILLTGYTDVESIIQAINSGEIYKYVTKPWDPVDLLNTVDKAVEKFELRNELKLKNKALEDALNELKTLDKAKTNFMILINHELKTPLSVISMYSQLLKETPLNTEQQKSVQRILESETRLNKLITDSLELTEAEAKVTKISPKKIKIIDVINNISQSYKQELDKKSIKVETQIHEPTIQMDEKCFTSICKKLFDNAVKFADPNTVIQIESHSNNGKTQIQFTNQGKKLDIEKTKDLLKPFTLDENVLNHSKGTGLGLAISSALLKLHNSELQFQVQKNSTQVGFTI